MQERYFDYFNGIEDGYKDTKKDPYYYPSKGKREKKYNPNWDVKSLILK